MRKAAVLPDPICRQLLCERRGFWWRHTCLSNSNDVDVLQDGWKNIGLDRRGYIVLAQLDIPQHYGVEARIFELR